MTIHNWHCRKSLLIAYFSCFSGQNYFKCVSRILVTFSVRLFFDQKSEKHTRSLQFNFSTWNCKWITNSSIIRAEFWLEKQQKFCLQIKNCHCMKAAHSLVIKIYFFFLNFIFNLPWECHFVFTKGQTISKANYGLLKSPKKTNEMHSGYHNLLSRLSDL